MSGAHQLQLGAPGAVLAPTSRRKRVDKYAHLPEQVAPVRFEIVGAPRTKNTGQAILVGGRPRIIPPKPYRMWFKAAMAQAPIVRAACPGRFLARVDVTAIFYRDRAVGDEDRFKIGLGDFLERVGVLKNDNLIHWTGATRLDKDAARPRVEVSITLAPIPPRPSEGR